MEQFGKFFVGGMMRGLKGTKEAEKWASFERRIETAKVVGPFAQNVEILRDREISPMSSEDRYQDILMVYHVEGQYILRESQIYYDNPMGDHTTSTAITDSEARPLYAYLDRDLHPVDENLPSYAVLLNWAKSVIKGWNDDDVDDYRFADIISELEEHYDLDDPEDEAEDEAEEAPEPIFVDPREQWARDVLKDAPFPPPEIPAIRVGEKATITQTLSLDLNGKKFPGKTRVLEVFLKE